MNPEIGKRFNRLVVVELAEPSKNKSIQFKCVCDCGNTIITRGCHLRSGFVKSCGCYRKEFKRTHGHSTNSGVSPTYTSWAQMLDRCRNTSNKRYADYGGRGIWVCDRWSSFCNFVFDMGNRPEGKTIERINNSLGYCPENCKWATPKEQQRNRRANHVLTFNGESLCIAEWAEKIGCSFTTVATRIRRGWTTERALTTPVGKYEL